MSNCHCNSGQDFASCCGPILSGEKQAETAEALMRARYCAFVCDEIDYLTESLHPSHRQNSKQL